MIRTTPVAVTAMLRSIALFLLPWAAAIAQTISTTATPASVTLGQIPTTLGDSATLRGLTSPTGTLTFILTAPSSAVVDTETITVNGNGTYTTPTGFTLPTVGAVTGTYSWAAVYSGDVNNPPLSTPGELVIISPASPLLALTAGPTVTLGSGTPLTASAVLANGYFETGTITFTLRDPSSAVVDTETVSVNGNGTYTTPVGFVPAVAGTYSWTAVYGGDGNNNQATSTTVTESVVQRTITTTANPLAVTLGTTQPTLGDSATLTNFSPSPTGTITFTLITPSSAVVDTETITVNGNGTYTTPTGFTLPTVGAVTGTWVWNATYAGNNPTLPTASEPVVVSKAAPSLALTAGPTVTLGSGTPLTASAVLANGYFETGTITFTLRNPSSAVVDTETVSVTGNGTYATPVGFVPAVAGTYFWTAVYSGDGNNLGSASPPATESVAPRAVAAVAIPTLAQWSLIGLVLAVGFIGVSRTSRRRPM